MRSALEATLLFQMRAIGLDPVQEYRFHKTRRWRFDFAMPDHKLGIECEGGTWKKSRHTTGKGFRDDCHKYNAAAILGWRVLRFTSDMIKKGEALQQIEDAIA